MIVKFFLYFFKVLIYYSFCLVLTFKVIANIHFLILTFANYAIKLKNVLVER